MLVSDKKFSFGTDILTAGRFIKLPHDHAEVAPVFMTNTFNVEDTADLEARYATGGYCYNRNRNPNRNQLMEAVNCMENGEASIASSSGMGAICNTLIAFLAAATSSRVTLLTGSCIICTWCSRSAVLIFSSKSSSYTKMISLARRNPVLRIPARSNMDGSAFLLVGLLRLMLGSWRSDSGSTQRIRSTGH